MSGFKAHLTSGLAVGTSIAVAGFTSDQLDITEAVSVGIIGTIGGLLPDIDSDTGKPLQLLFQLISVMIPVLLYKYALEYFKSSVAFSICYFTLFYLFINYVICPLIKKLTAHRGVMHSIPFAIMCAEGVYIISFQVNETYALYSGLGLFAGALTHLILDELSSMKIKGVFLSFNNYSGTALTFVSKDILPMLTVYGFMIFFGVTIYLNFQSFF